MTITPHRIPEGLGATATVPAQHSRRATTAVAGPGRDRRHPSRLGGLGVEIATLVGRVRSASTSPSAVHLLVGLLVTAVTAAGTALLLAPA